MPPDLTSLSFWEGLGIGLAFGIVFGTASERAFELFREAVQQWRAKRMTEHRDTDESLRARLRLMGWILGVAALVQVVTGGAILYLNSKLTSFVSCQADYNQQSYDARKPRIKAAKAQDAAMAAWLQTLPPLFAPRTPGTQPDPRLIKAFRQELLNTVHTYTANLVAQQEHPYPPDPKDTCGEY
jgi:hypothetical protein